MLQTYYFGRKSWYDKEEADKEIQQLKYERMNLRNELERTQKELDGIKMKFKDFMDNVCKKVLEAKDILSTTAQDAQMNFYEEFIADRTEGK